MGFKVFFGTLVHSKLAEQIEIIENGAIGFDEETGEVSTFIVYRITKHACVK